jgi:hypothetical protein
MLKYRVRDPLVAVLGDPGMPGKFVTIEPGSVITVKGDAQHFGFVEVRYGVQFVKVFMRDIEKRAERVAGQTA